ncbi:MAG: type 2 isopentenyl-diphosphate Delta-isomerase [Candidatus Methylarchaceae archaeon HK01M]|nr:type 2 isopentenyl-diphosphate Delta-isomerase [Candidatus Methylarchaceae archaeon HK01M]
MDEELTKRKVDHVDICLGKDVEAKTVTTLFECVHLIHNALPDLNFDSIDTSTIFLNHKFSAPILIDAMIGGSPISLKINENLALAAEELKIGMVVGSQRAGLSSSSLAETYSIVRKKAPDIFLASNIGASQLVKGFSKEEAKKCIDMIGADAFVVHLNPLQEVVQVGGDPQYEGVINKIHELTTQLDVPMIVKEVGFGISKEVAIKLEMAGVSAINISGAGGTSWSAVEHYRALALGDKKRSNLGQLFWDWGIPTVVSLIETKKAVKIPIIASGGIRTGLDIAKSLVLGANLAGMALPLLKPATVSKDAIVSLLQKVIYELKTAMFAVGCRNVQAMKRERYVITGKLAEWKIVE